MYTIEGGLDEFDETFGVGPYSIYGQPLLNARAAASAGATLQCLRITAQDATLANTIVWVQYKATPAVEANEDESIVAEKAKLQVRFVSAPVSNVKSISNFDSTFDLVCAKPTVESDGESNVNLPTLPGEGWQQLPFIGATATGRGTYGNAYSFRISNHPRADKTTSYKNYYIRIFEGTTTLEGSTRVTLQDDVIVNNESLFMEQVINGYGNDITGSKHLHLRVNTDVEKVLYEYYTADGMYPNTDITEYAFDPILGIDRTLAFAKSSDYTAFSDVVSSDTGMPGYEIVNDEGSTQFNTMTGIKLAGGSDGEFASTTDPDKMDARRKAIRSAYYYAFTGDTNYKYDRDIKSKTKYPLDAVFDADFPIGVTDDDSNEVYARSLKGALAQLVEDRNEDCFCFMDLGTDTQSMLDEKPGDTTGFTEREAAYDYASELDDYVNWWNYSIDAYYGKIRDPYNKKLITVTSTYNLSKAYPKMWKVNGGKHIPYAGSKYGVISGFIYKTVFPVFDVDLDSDALDKLTDQHINYAQINSKDEIIRGSQSTRYPEIGNALTMSNLSEINNALIILDIKKDAIKLVENYAYNFNEASDIALFNRDAEELVTKYSAAQVKSISASFSRTDEEAELGILHLTITVVHKALVKINLIDIDVNRSVETTS
jgi:hypothetical protein